MAAVRRGDLDGADVHVRLGDVVPAANGSRRRGDSGPAARGWGARVLPLRGCVGVGGGARNSAVGYLVIRCWRPRVRSAGCATVGREWRWCQSRRGRAGRRACGRRGGAGGAVRRIRLRTPSGLRAARRVKGRSFPAAPELLASRRRPTSAPRPGVPGTGRLPGRQAGTAPGSLDRAPGELGCRPRDACGSGSAASDSSGGGASAARQAPLSVRCTGLVLGRLRAHGRVPRGQAEVAAGWYRAARALRFPPSSATSRRSSRGRITQLATPSSAVGDGRRSCRRSVAAGPTAGRGSRPGSTGSRRDEIHVVVYRRGQKPQLAMHNSRASQVEQHRASIPGRIP